MLRIRLLFALFSSRTRLNIQLASISPLFHVALLGYRQLGTLCTYRPTIFFCPKICCNLRIQYKGGRRHGLSQSTRYEKTKRSQKRQKCGACFRVRCALGAGGDPVTCLDIRVLTSGDQRGMMASARLDVWYQLSAAGAPARGAPLGGAWGGSRRAEECTSTSRVVVPRRTRSTVHVVRRRMRGVQYM